MSEHEAEPGRVSTLELFFDLVFVFTVSQLTTVLVEDPHVGGVVHAALLFGLIWWMFNGYVWLTNELPPTTDPRRVLLFVAMAGFLTMALAVPVAFNEGDGAKVFAAGYMLVTAVHAGLFSRTSSMEASRAIARLAPFNLVGAAFVLLGAFTHGRTQSALWLAALVIEAAAPRLGGRLAGFTIRPAHFVERHGLIIIIALGESLIAIALGAAGLPINASLIAVSVVTLGVAACLWWVYFRVDIERAEQALFQECATQRAVVALNAYNYAHIPLLLGVVTFAAGVKKAAAHPLDHATTAGALYVAAGIALYLCGHAVFRRTLHLGGPWLRLATSAAVLATVPIGVYGAALAQLAVVLLLLCLCATLDLRATRAM
ncbi:low temperature requirement protein A [Streptomyces albidochromogenes]|uniref:Low temperature requirement protein A n=1 Tax=Streptomyces albidochromogenes TaxID=329524 RepID=A0ABW6FF21_9ACTN